MSKKVLIITLLMIIFVFNIGYGKTNNSYIISETSNSNREFNIEFKEAKIISSIGVNLNNTFTKISSDRKNLRINVADLSYPGAGVKVEAIIKNNGTIPAKIESINVDGLSENSAIKVKVLDEKQKVLEINEEAKINFIVEWDRDWNKEVNEKANFVISLNYVQAY